MHSYFHYIILFQLSVLTHEILLNGQRQQIETRKKMFRQYCVSPIDRFAAVMTVVTFFRLCQLSIFSSSVCTTIVASKKMIFRTTFDGLGLLRRYFGRNSLNHAQLAPKNNVKSKRKVATIHREANSSAVTIKFVYENDSIQYRKSITCVRRLDESIPFSMERVKEKIVGRINRKCQKKGLTEVCENIEVKLDGVNDEHINWNILLDNFNDTESNVVLRIDNDTYAIEYNPPSIELIQLPSEVYPGFDCYPSKVEVCGDMSQCTFKWQRKLPRWKKWYPCKNGESFMYRVSQDDAGSELQLTCSLTNKDGDVVAERHSNVARVAEQGPDMAAIDGRHKHTSHILPDHQFRVVTYNLLADFYTTTEYSRTQIFPYCSPSILDIDFRKSLFIRELLGYHCDVMCLQEVDQSVFEHDLHHQFGRNHFKGVYARKEPLPEGLATFYNSNKFT